MKLAITLAISAGFALAVTGAEAGALKCGGSECKASYAGAEYSSSKCQAPAEPTLSVEKAEAYNESVKAAEGYVNKVKTYYTCLTDEANADLKDVGVAVQNAVKKLQDAEKAKIDKIQVTLKNAADKLNAQQSAPAPAAAPKR
jgi:gas vesicle protein